MLMDEVIVMKTPAFVNGGFPIAPGARPVPALRRQSRPGLPAGPPAVFGTASLTAAKPPGLPPAGFPAVPPKASGPVLRTPPRRVSRRAPRETGPGRAMTIVVILAAALGVAACPVAHSASESRSHPILLAQEPLAGSPSETSGPVEDDRTDISGFAALEAAILRIESEIAELGRLAEWQARLLSAARTDPVGAWRQRRPYASCLETPLEPWCDRLNGMYRDGGRTAGQDSREPAGRSYGGASLITSDNGAKVPRRADQ